MRYLGWAMLALVAYTLVPLFVKKATAAIPTDVVVLITNGILVATAVGIVFVSDTTLLPHLTDDRAVYAYGGGLALAVGIISYYRALAGGPVSVVVPIFGMFIATSSIVGVAVLDESLTPRRAAGILLAVVSIYLLSAE